MYLKLYRNFKNVSMHFSCFNSFNMIYAGFSFSPHGTLQAWGGVAGKLPSRKRPWGVGGQPAEHEPAVCPGGQEGQRHPGLYQEKCGQQE